MSSPQLDPGAVLSLRDCQVFRTVDDADHPVLVVSDGVTTLALGCGLRGLTPEVAASAQRLADAISAFARSVEEVVTRSTA